MYIYIYHFHTGGLAPHIENIPNNIDSQQH
jgi:hypothetical protein